MALTKRMTRKAYLLAVRELSAIVALPQDQGDLELENVIRSMEARGVVNAFEKAIFEDAVKLLNTDRA